MRTISFVIAVYRNAGSLRPTYEQLKGLFAGPLRDYACEFVFVDDGSDDGSLKELLALRREDSRVRIVSFSRNFGQMAAVIAGFRYAKGEAVVNKAADMQEPVEAVVAMVKEWESGGKVVFGKRLSRQDGLAADLLGNAYWRLLKLINPKLPSGSDFFLLDRQAVDVFNKIEESDRFFPVDVLWLGFNPRIIPYKRLPRVIGRSQWSVSKKIKAGIDGILHSTYLPIRIISLVGILVAALSCVGAAVAVIQSLARGAASSGWHLIVFLLIFLDGVIMLMLGIIGEYVWRVYNQAKGRPVYIVKEFHG